jgi:DNA-directed RNA polymerase specialized sigma subunit
MTAKEYLQRIRSERLEIQQFEERIEEQRYSLLPSGIRYDVDKVQTSPDDPMMRVYAEIDKLERKIKEHLERLTTRYNIAMSNILLLDKSEHRQVLALYYLGQERLTWEMVAERMSFSEQRIYQLHNEAIAELEKIWKD